MRRLTATVAAAVAACLLAAAAPSTRSLDGVTVPERITLRGEVLSLNGLGLRSLTILHIHGYVAALYVPSPSRDPTALLAEAGPKRLEIHFVHAASRERIEAELKHSRRLVCSQGCPPGDEASFGQLLATVRDVVPGDVITYLLDAQGVEVLRDGQDVARIHDPGFAHRLLDSMVGAQALQASLRDGLLGRD